MDFIGSGRRLRTADIREAAGALDVEEAALKAVLAVEARARGFDAKNRPVILFEPHVFWREFAGDLGGRERARAEGLAYPNWGAKPYPRTQDARYRQLQRAVAIDRGAALRATSWGLGQVMGFNHALAGFGDVEQFVEAIKAGEREQLQAMAAFIAAKGLAPALKARDWAAFARGYNGPAHARNGYAERLAAAYRQASAPGGRRPASQGASEETRQIQRGLAALGHDPGPADGRLGPRTAAALRAFQRSRGLTADGLPGPLTRAALAQAAERHQQSRKQRSGEMTDSKPWYASRSIIGALVTIAASIAGLFGMAIEPALVSSLTEYLVLLVTAGGGLLSLVGRLRATRRIV